jgi:hypothetical protein
MDISNAKKIFMYLQKINNVILKFMNKTCSISVVNSFVIAKIFGLEKCRKFAPSSTPSPLLAVRAAAVRATAFHTRNLNWTPNLSKIRRI